MKLKTATTSLLTTAVVILLTVLPGQSALAADNDHDHNSHQEIPGAVLPLETNEFLTLQPGLQTEQVGPQEQQAGASCSPKATNGSPVILRTGEFVWSTTDIVLNGRPPIHLTRSYRAFDSRDGLFGKGWSTHCEKALIPIIDYETNADPALAYIYRLENGQRYKFIESSEGNFQTPAALLGITLEANSDNTATIRSLGGADETYNATGQLILESDRSGNTINYTYRNGSLSKIADTNGRSLTLTVDSTGHVSQVIDQTGRNWSYSYNSDGTLASVRNPLGGTINYEYVEVKRAANSVPYYAISEVTDETGVVVISVNYDDIGRVVSYTQGENEYTYSESRGLIYKTDSEGADWSYTIDELGRKTKVVYPNRYSELFEYDNNSKLTKFTDKVGTEFSWTYDELGRMTAATTPDGTTSLAYLQGTNWVTSITSPTGRVVSTSYDPRGNPTSITDAAGFNTALTWTTSGDLLTTTDAMDGVASYTVNAIGLTTSITDQLGRKTVLDYDNRGNLSTTTNALGNSSAMSYDSLDRLISSTDARGQVTSYSYDAAGRLLSLTDAKGGTTSFAYDIYGRQISETRADDSVISYTYRPDNLVDIKTDPRGVTEDYRYNDAKNLISIRAGVAGVSENTALTYDRMNRLSRASYSVNLDYEYDVMSRVTAESYSPNRVNYQYNEEGELIGVTANRESLLYEYDDRGLLTGFTTPQGQHTYVHDALGRRISHTLPSGATNTFEYDAAGQLTKLDYSQSSGEILEYAYDALGQVISITSSTNTAWSYSYDSINRLVGAEHDQSYTYQYDELGNRLDNGGVYDLFNKLLENNDFTFDYDEAGNLISKVAKDSGEQTRYTYNAYGRLSELEIAPAVDAVASYSANYAYDYTGRRIRKVANLETTAYGWMGTNLIGEFAGLTLKKTYRYDGGYAAAEFSDENGTYQVQTDHLDTPLTLTDSSDVVVWSQDLGPYGIDTSLTEQTVEYRQRSPGQYFDADTGLNYNLMRHYDSSVGRYITSDPIGLLGGANSYTYASANPTTLIDPTGEIGILGAVAAGAWNIHSQYRKNGGFRNFDGTSFAIATGLGLAGGGIVAGGIRIVKGHKLLAGSAATAWKVTKGVAAVNSAVGVHQYVGKNHSEESYKENLLNSNPNDLLEHINPLSRTKYGENLNHAIGISNSATQGCE